MFLVLKGIPENSQYMNQLIYFNTFPSKQQQSITLAKNYFGCIKGICNKGNIQLLVVLLPSELEINSELNNQIKLNTGWNQEELDVTKSLKNNLVNELNRLNIATLDLEDDFKTSNQKLYWKADQHLNVVGHEFVSSVLFRER